MFGRLNESRAISLASVNGPVLLTIPSDSNAELKAGTVHGGIANDFGLPVRRGDYVGRDLAGHLGQGGARIKLGNVNGSITIKHAPDGRPLSPVMNLLAEKIKDKDKDDDDDDDCDADDAKLESQRAAREAAREAARAQSEARRAQVEAQRAQLEAQRAQRQAQMEAQRAQLEAQRAQLAAQKEGQRAQLEAQRAQVAAQAEAQRAQQEAQRAQQEAQRAQVEGQRAALEGQREAQRAQLEAQRAQAEGARAAQEAQRVARSEAARVRAEAQRVVREVVRTNTVNVESSNTLRLVERETKSFTVSGTPHVNLQTFDGSITVRGWDKQEVQLMVSKRATDARHSTQHGTAFFGHLNRRKLRQEFCEPRPRHLLHQCSGQSGCVCPAQFDDAPLIRRRAS